MRTVPFPEFDQRTNLGIAREEGREKGKAEGIKEGIKEGARKKALEIARAMVADGFSAEVIKKYTGLDEKEIPRKRNLQTKKNRQ